MRRLPIFVALAMVAALPGCREGAAPAGNPVPAPQAQPAVPAAAVVPSAAPVPPRPAATAKGFELPQRFAALGTEPFWSAKVDGATLVYATPEDQAGQRIVVTRRADGATTLLAGTLDGIPFKLAVTAGRCSDGMSDTIYPYTVRRVLGEDVQHGCARPE